MMNVWFHLVAIASGFLYGFGELIVAHRRMKSEAVCNFWGGLYLVGTSALACGLFALLNSKEPPLFNLFGESQLNGWALAILAGPLTGLGVRHVGTNIKGGKELISLHNRIFTFLREEVQHSVDVARIQLSRQVAEKWVGRVEELGEMASDYVNSVGSQGKTTKQETDYIAALVRERATVTLARYLIESYGDTWVRQRLLKPQTEGT